MDSAIEEIKSRAIDATEEALLSTNEATAAAHEATTELAKTAGPAYTKSVSGDMLSIFDAATRPAVEVIGHIEPVQEGSGDPSPDNVRAISGWSAASIQRTGKNLYPTGDLEFTGNYRIDFDPPLPPGTYTMGALITSGDTDTTKNTCVVINKEGISMTSFLLTRDTYNTATVTTAEPIYSMRFYAGSTLNNSKGDTCTWKNIMLNVGSEALSYEPYEGQTLTTSLPETVYGGELDWITGKLVCTHTKLVFDGVTKGRMFNATDSGTGVSAYISKSHLALAGKPKSDALCNMSTYAKFATAGPLVITLPTSLTGATSTDDAATMVAKFNAACASLLAAGTPLEVVYELETPYTIQLTPQQLDLLSGQCNIWGSGGTTDLIYIVEPEKRLSEAIQDFSSEKIVVSKTGNMVSIPDGSARPAVNLVSHIEPTQAGSGDPSPANIRAISGWDKVNVQRAGRNLFSSSFRESYVSRGFSIVSADNGTTTISGTRTSAGISITPFTFPVPLPAGTYTLALNNNIIVSKGGGLENNVCVWCEKITGGYTYTTYADEVNKTKTIVADSPLKSIIIRIGENIETIDNLIIKPMLEFGEKPTAYELYNGEALTETLPQTIYGGTMDWNTGVLTVDNYALVTFDGTEDYYISPTSSPVTQAFNLDIEKVTGMSSFKSYRDRSKSNMFAPIEDTLIQSNLKKNNYYWTTSGFWRFGWGEPGATVEEFKAFLQANPLQILVPLTPLQTTYQLTPQQLDIIKGFNTVWSNTGDTDLVYVADTKLYIDNKFEELRQALLSTGANV